MSQSVDQSNLEKYREQFQINQKTWYIEAEMLKPELREAEKKLVETKQELEGSREYRRQEKAGENYYYEEDKDIAIEKELEREYRFTWEWIWKIKRRLHELIRWEREELEYLGRLERYRKVGYRTNRGNRTTTQDGETGAKTQRPHPPRGKGNKSQTKQELPHTNKAG